jgi:tetratricopeptide (TPR) repeat protein
MCNHPWHHCDHYHYYYGYYGGFFPFWDPFWLDWYAPWYRDDAWWATGYYPCGQEGCVAPAQYILYRQPADADAEPADSTPAIAPATDEPSLGNEFLHDALDAFHRGEYAQAVRLGNHAAVESPKNPKVHEAVALALFALKDYRGANMEAHLALALGPVADWNTLYAYYGDLPPYTAQLDALVQHLHDHRDAADARFLLGYHDLMMGHREEAKRELEQVVKMVPHDKLAAQLLEKLGGKAPKGPTPPPPPPPKKPSSPPSGPKEF